MQLLIEILVFVISTQRLAEFFSIEDVRIDNDMHVLLIYKIAVTKQTTNFFFSSRDRNFDTDSRNDQETL
jgi:hypothetical protein